MRVIDQMVTGRENCGLGCEWAWRVNGCLLRGGVMSECFENVRWGESGRPGRSGSRS